MGRLWERGTSSARRALLEAAESAGAEEICLEALAEARQRARSAPDDPDARQELVRCHMRISNLRSDATDDGLGPKGRADRRNAEEAWDRFLALDPANPDADLAFRMARVFDTGPLENPDKRLRALEIGLEHTDIPTAGRYERLARAYHAVGRFEEAGVAAERAVELAPRIIRRLMRREMNELMHDES